MSPRNDLSVLVDVAEPPCPDLPGTQHSCFEDCSLLRTHCPGPAAMVSRNNDGLWLPICRLTAVSALKDNGGRCTSVIDRIGLGDAG